MLILEANNEMAPRKTTATITQYSSIKLDIQQHLTASTGTTNTTKPINNAKSKTRKE